MAIKTEQKSHLGRYASLYLLVIGGVVLLWGLLQLGSWLTADAITPVPAQPIEHPGFFAEWLAHLNHPVAHFFLQLLVIMGACRLCGFLARQISQPAVMGEIFAGILLGPSLFGLIWPEAMTYLFPADSIKPLQLVSQLGLILFMFTVGLDVDLAYLRSKSYVAVVISHVSIVGPYLLGVMLAIALYSSYAPPGIAFIPFALFMGIAMSITAFPVLARIIHEREIGHTPFGSLALICAAIDDASAWCILAFVVAIVKATSLTGAVFTVGLSGLYIFVMFQVVRPWLATKVQVILDKGNNPTSLALLVLFVSALVTEIIGIHALFGAFVAGAMMPTQGQVRQQFLLKLEDISVLVLLPLFFTLTGLRTQIGLLNQPVLWLICVGIIAVAIAGKFGSTFITARALGQNIADASRLGILMNTRGLMELIVLNIGYDLGILSREIFTMLVIMAIVTTFMTGPALAWVEKRMARLDAEAT